MNPQDDGDPHFIPMYREALFAMMLINLELNDMEDL